MLVNLHGYKLWPFINTSGNSKCLQRKHFCLIPSTWIMVKISTFLLGNLHNYIYIYTHTQSILQVCKMYEHTQEPEGKKIK